MSIQIIDFTSSDIYLKELPKKRRASKGQQLEFSWAPELNTNTRAIDFSSIPYSAMPYSSIPEPFTISELFDKIFNEFSPVDLCKLELVSKPFQVLTIPLWQKLRREKGFSYTWELCSQVRYKDKINYIITKFFENSIFKRYPTSKVKVMTDSYPVFKAFFEAMDVVNNSHKGVEQFEDELKKEPLLHAIIKIEQSMYGKNRRNSASVPIPFIPEKTEQMAFKVVCDGGTNLARYAVKVCKKLHPQATTIRLRYLPFLSKLTRKAEEKGDSLGQQLLTDSVKDKLGIYHIDFLSPDSPISFEKILYRKYLRELSEEEKTLEKTHLRGLLEDIASWKDAKRKQIPPGRYREVCDIMRLYVQLEEYDIAESIADRLMDMKINFMFPQNFISIIKVKTHFQKFDEVNKLYDILISMKKNNCLNDITFLMDFSHFKLSFNNGDPKVVDDQLMKYWMRKQWHGEIMVNYANNEIDIYSVEDLQSEPFIKLLELIIQVKARLNNEADIQWFRHFREMILIDTNDLQACHKLSKEIADFMLHPYRETIPLFLLEKIVNIQIRSVNESKPQLTLRMNELQSQITNTMESIQSLQFRVANLEPQIAPPVLTNGVDATPSSKKRVIDSEEWFRECFTDVSGPDDWFNS
jgi:hypothetical protein